MKNKLIISSLIFIIGITILILGILIPNIRNNNSNNNDNNKPIKNEEQSNLNQKFDITISNFTITKKEKNSLSFAFSINNANETKFNPTKLYIRFYNNNNLLSTYEYDIDELNAYDTINVESNMDFEYENITKYVFIVNNVEKELMPIDLSH